MVVNHNWDSYCSLKSHSYISYFGCVLFGWQNLMDNKGQGERLSEWGVGKAVVKCLVCCTFDSMALCIRRSKVQAVVQGPSLRIVSCCFPTRLLVQRICSTLSISTQVRAVSRSLLERKIRAPNLRRNEPMSFLPPFFVSFFFDFPRKISTF